MSLKQKALSGMFWTLIQQFSTQGIGFVVSIVLARLLLPEQFGLIAMLGIFVGLGTNLLESGLGQSLIRTTNPDLEDYSTVFYFNLVGSFIVYFIIFFCAPYIAIFYSQPQLESITRWYCLIFITNALSSIHYTRLTKQMLFKKELTITIPSLILSSIVGITMAYSGYGVWSLVASGLTQSLAVAVQMWIRSDWRPVLSFNKEKFKYHFDYGYKLTLSGILDTLFTNAYVIIIGKYFAPAQVGFYNRADTLKQLPVSNISNVLNKVTFPLFAQVKDDDVRLKDIYRKIMQMVLFFVAPILLIMAALGEPLFRFLFTEKWLPAVPYFQILCWAGILYPIHAYNLNILKVKGRSDLFLKLEIIKRTMVGLIIAMSLPYGIYGLLYGGIITSVLAFFINTYYSGKFLNYSSWHQMVDVLPTLILATISGASVCLMDQYFQQYLISDFLRLVLGTAIGTIIFLLLSKLFKLNTMNELINIIKKQ
ncbi:lipopolysaccharide biosynthesis protein [Flavobacterium sp.]|uniref:lipopolysaccharide biosynthesis protein n=1 Tax=Flavobacterium sp. TaxID=239 RepID=UPI001B5CA895|nr:lipopolysaccharide biosynthesis protein [Flavobacterium sp.]MBP6182575.1 lipopolysaccharide biosynthesis protein [Flavobacterium sp.]